MKDLYISPTRLDNIQLCWRKYNYSDLRKLVPFVRSEKMDRGSVGHKILAYYYREIGLNISRADSEKKARDLIIEEAFKIGTLEAVKTELSRAALNKLFAICESYFRFYQGEDWLPLLDNKNRPLVEVPLTKVLYERPDAENVEGVRIIFNGIIDMIVAPSKHAPVRVTDHKFKEQFSELNPMHNQLALYSAITGIPDVVRNDSGAQKDDNPNKFRRQTYRYEKSQMEENLQWAVYYTLEAEYHELMDFWPPNPTSCDKFGGCLFRGVCNTIPAGREGVINASFRTNRKRFSIYEGDITEVVGTEKGPAKVVEEGETTVLPLRSAGGEAGDSPEEPGERGGLVTVPLVQENGEARSELRDGETSGDASSTGLRNASDAPEAQESFADRLLRKLE